MHSIPITDANSSGVELPAAMNVAPATSSLRRSFWKKSTANFSSSTVFTLHSSTAAKIEALHFLATVLLKDEQSLWFKIRHCLLRRQIYFGQVKCLHPNSVECQIKLPTYNWTANCGLHVADERKASLWIQKDCKHLKLFSLIYFWKSEHNHSRIRAILGASQIWK